MNDFKTQQELFTWLLEGKKIKGRFTGDIIYFKDGTLVGDTKEGRKR